MPNGITPNPVFDKAVLRLEAAELTPPSKRVPVMDIKGYCCECGCIIRQGEACGITGKGYLICPDCEEDRYGE